MKNLSYFLFLITSLNFCNGQNKEPIPVLSAKALVYLLHNRDSIGIYGMITNVNIKEGKKTGILKNDIEVIAPYLDSLKDLSKLKYVLTNELSNWNITTIKVYLRNNTSEKAWIEIYFTEFDKTQRRKINNFHFSRTYTSNTIDSELPTQRKG